MPGIRRRTVLALAAALAFFAPAALAMTWDGTVRADETVLAEAPSDGILETLLPEAGQRVTAGERLGGIRKDCVYAPADGTIEAVHLVEGDDIDGAVLEIDPREPYEIACTTAGARRTAENMFLHAGERLYARCQADGEHRAEGRVISVAREAYRVQVTEGEFVIGESVSLYRSATYDEESCVGSGVVETSALIACTGAGKLLELFVREGDRVSRGDLLWKSAEKEETEVLAPADGVVTALLAEKGSRVAEDQGILEIATHTVLSVPVDEDDAEGFARGDELRYYRADDPHETLLPAKVVRILHEVTGGKVTVELQPEEGGILPIGLTVTITDGANGAN